MKVTIRYMDDSTSTIDVEGDGLTLGTNDEYFTIEDEDEQPLGWIVRENVKYVILGELIDSFKDDDRNDKNRDDRDRRDY